MGQINERQFAEVRRSVPFFWYGTRRGRRTAVVLGAAAVALGYVSAVVCWFLAPSDPAMWTTFTLGGIGLLVYAWAYAVLLVASGGAVAMGENRLDERQLAERRQVRSLAHRATAWLLGLTLALTFFLDGADHFLVRIPTAAAVIYVFALFLTHLILPHLITGWRLPDPLAEDEENEGPLAEPSGNGAPA
ncbi:hypothetical protein Sme01_04450 [Sphaerisporangium melleum]|uniref:Uncharacterized protein n=1 Tax=Sphaerisporangium melleum TaxID=321316 RepID=A0A917VBU2_9ACTN|nr:hypothetical protein [Sphaerisporangium melleum]GGK62457.1 hypothetical protein GCM10007964_02000 [Sphaerisporangium melleum]GII67969.1 hypothetical protein Sme01_04450 [Sphaerisporangium melleum]